MTDLTLTARTPEDLLALTPLVLGFVPEHSVVMLTFCGARSFHGRVDLPDTPEATELIRGVLLQPVLRHRVATVALIGFAEDARASAPTIRDLATHFRAAGIAVPATLVADRCRWWLAEDVDLDRHPGVAYDVSCHPFAAEAVASGRVTRSSRAALRATLDPDPARCARVARYLATVPVVPAPAETGWLRTVIGRCVETGEGCDDATAARVLVDCTDLVFRDDAWLLMTRDNARRHLDVWTDLLRRAPRGYGAAPAALAAFAAWLCGDGALAWCALDRCRDEDPQYSLAAHLSAALDNALPPWAWDDVIADHAHATTSA